MTGWKDQRQALEDWLEFVRGNAHSVRRRPEILLQEAANQPEVTAPCGAARIYLAAKPSRVVILRTNKPHIRHKCLMTLSGHSGSVYSCALSPDGTRIVSASRDGTIKVWETETGIELLTLKNRPTALHACAFLADGRHVVSGAADGTLTVWDIVEGRADRTLVGHDAPIQCCVASPDGRLIVSGSSDGTLKLWETQTGAMLGNLAQDTSGEIHIFQSRSIADCAFSPDGRLVAACSDVTLRAFDIASQEERMSVTWKPRPPALPMASCEVAKCCAFSPDGRRASCGAGNGTMISFGRIAAQGYGELRIWDVGSGEHVQTIKAHDDFATAVAYSPDGCWIASCGADGTVAIWDADDGSEITRFWAHTSAISSCSFSADGSLLLTGSCDESAKIWMLERVVGERQAEHHGVSTCCFAADGARLLTGAQDGSVVIWNSESGAAERTLRGHPDVISAMAVSPDLSLAAIGSGRIGRNAEAQLRLWNIRSGDERFLHNWDEGGSVRACTFTPDGRRLVSGWVGWKNVELKVLDTAPSHALQSFGKRSRLTLSFAMIGGGRVLAVASGDTIDVIDVETGECIVSTKGNSPLAVLPDRRSLIVGIGEKTLAEWNLQGTPSSWGEPHERLGNCVVSPDGMRLITTCGPPVDLTQDPPGEIKLWDVQTRCELASAKTDKIMRACAFTVDGRYLVGCTWETLRIWDSSSLVEVAAYLPTGEYVAFDTAGERLALADSLGTIHLLIPAGLPQGPAVVTAEYLYDFDAHRWMAAPSAQCAWCSKRFDVAPELRETMGRIRSADATLDGEATTPLAAEAWNESALVSDCPACHRPLKFNPVMADWRDLTPATTAGTEQQNHEELLEMQRRILTALEANKAAKKTRWWAFWRAS